MSMAEFEGGEATEEVFVPFAERAALRKLGSVPADFEFFHWKFIGETDAMLFRGGVPRLLGSGKRKGKKTWEGQPFLECVVTRGEIDSERASFVSATGKCGECQGTKKTWASWDHKTGNTFRECRSCGGTGTSSLGNTEK